jgi:hypothetical protein
MSRTIDYAKCPQCGKEYKQGFENYWMTSAFGEYSFNWTDHVCEKCGCKFKMTVKKQVVFNTSVIK